MKLVVLALFFVTVFAGLKPLPHEEFSRLLGRRRRELNTTSLFEGCQRRFARTDAVVVSWLNCHNFNEPAVIYDSNCGAGSEFIVSCPTGDCIVSISGADNGVSWGCSYDPAPLNHYHVVTTQNYCSYDDKVCSPTTSGSYFGFGASGGNGQTLTATDCSCHTDCVVSAPTAFSTFCTAPPPPPPPQVNDYYASAGGGATGYGLIPANSAYDFGTGDFMIEFWMLTSFVNSGTVNLLSDATGKLNLYWTGLQFYFVLDDGAGSTTYIDSSAGNIGLTNVWTHVAFGRDSSTNELLFYKDGVKHTGWETVTSTCSNCVQNLNGLGQLKIADAVGGQNWLLAYFDELRFWNVLRTPTQLNDFKDADVSAETGLVSMYRFELNYEDSQIGSHLLTNAGEFKIFAR
mmetsp:Transcript_21567/g.29623  ORF Transcript_21567/g.29623 Transcript_21567/m.29623 type:complete len:402 (+) Transcript_21567:31-1236(+)|eukprot:CAMPEP_0201489208 /NCGR_PEP_ID=MMETSP0151_2-20130828/21296_1 /ASSEMBLY_ACC=CAM_ASM_000257 /TAXON_ID=200890 /ORGANISM="Paramoeba atlantica, Strain 621/1 / CCAP 1560/9" /LENGTH=401 /DNA_ID=CAMNT_0047874719 /DNA_START=28 /DNA_END=1233 /DNA_ORIENTATION=+